jgi:hypothetical protein
LNCSLWPLDNHTFIVNFAVPVSDRELRALHHEHELGPVAVIGELNFVVALPKTRSGKIMRRVLKAQAGPLSVGFCNANVVQINIVRHLSAGAVCPSI